MDDFKDRTKARHAQMFELLRQSGPKAQTSAVTKRYLDDGTSSQIRDTCLTSLRPLPQSGKFKKRPAKWTGPFSLLKLRKTKPHSNQR